jgi:hypothetical protein
MLPAFSTIPANILHMPPSLASFHAHFTLGSLRLISRLRAYHIEISTNEIFHVSTNRAFACFAIVCAPERPRSFQCRHRSFEGLARRLNLLESAISRDFRFFCVHPVAFFRLVVLNPSIPIVWRLPVRPPIGHRTCASVDTLRPMTPRLSAFALN